MSIESIISNDGQGPIIGAQDSREPIIGEISLVPDKPQRFKWSTEEEVEISFENFERVFKSGADIYESGRFKNLNSKSFRERMSEVFKIRDSK